MDNNLKQGLSLTAQEVLQSPSNSMSVRNQAFMSCWLKGALDDYYAQYPVDLSIDVSTLKNN